MYQQYPEEIGKAALQKMKHMAMVVRYQSMKKAEPRAPGAAGPFGLAVRWTGRERPLSYIIDLGVKIFKTKGDGEEERARSQSIGFFGPHNACPSP